MKVHEILKTLNSTSKKNEKISIIKANRGNDAFVKVLKHTYNKIGINYYVKKMLPVDGVGIHSLDNKDSFQLLNYMLEELSERNITGNKALNFIYVTISQFVIEDQDIIIKILKRDLKCGFSASSINKAIPNLIPVFKIAKGEDIEGGKSGKDHTYKIWEDSWFISRKLDGCRCPVVKHNGVYTFYSSSGNIKDQFSKIVPELDDVTGDMDNIVFDGEMCLFDGDKEDFKGISSEFQKKNHTIENPRFKIFDCLTYDEFFSQTSTRKFSERYKNLENLFKNKTYKTMDVLEQIPLTKETFKEWEDKIKDTWKDYKGTEETEGWEGFMCRKDALYKGKRSTDILKVKVFLDDEWIIEDIETGEFTTTIKGQGQVTFPNVMTAVIIKLYGIYPVNIGSGWDIDQRKDFALHPEHIIGKEITVRFQGYSSNKKGGKSLRIPTLKKLWENGRNV